MTETEMPTDTEIAERTRRQKANKLAGILNKYQPEASQIANRLRMAMEEEGLDYTNPTDRANFAERKGVYPSQVDACVA